MPKFWNHCLGCTFKWALQNLGFLLLEQNRKNPEILKVNLKRLETCQNLDVPHLEERRLGVPQNFNF